MKQKVTITFTVEPREYGEKGTAANALKLTAAIFSNGTLPAAHNTRIRVAVGKLVQYLPARSSK